MSEVIVRMELSLISLPFSYSVRTESPTEAGHRGHERSGGWNGLDIHGDTVLQSRPRTLPCKHYERTDKCKWWNRFNFPTLINSILLITFQNCHSICAISQNCTDTTSICDLSSQCCDLNHYRFDSPGIGRNLLYLMVMGIILYALLFLKEFGYLKKLRYKLCHATDPSALETMPTVGLDSDVLNEKLRVRNMLEKDVKEENMVMRDLVKVYGKFMAVKGVSVAVKE